MEELKEVVNLIASLPTLATWGFVGFFAYKVLIVGSIYGTIRFVVDKLYLLFKQDVSKSELSEIINKYESNLEDYRRQLTVMDKAARDAKAETERVLHMYQILKEKKNV